MTQLAKKYKMKPNTILNYKGEILSEFNMTDEKAEKVLKEFPGFAGMFEIIPEEQPKEEKKEQPEEKKKPVKRTPKKAK